VKQRIKRWLFALLGKDPEGVVLVFRSGAGWEAMEREVRGLPHGRRVFAVDFEEGSAWQLFRRWRKRWRRHRIALAPVLFDGDPKYRAMRLAAFLLAPRKILAYNARNERHHLKLAQPLASWLFWRGAPLDRIWLRPWWFPFARERTRDGAAHEVFEGRPVSRARRRVGIVTPYFPYPLSHGGAVRMFHLIRELAKEFDVWLFSFTENGARPDDIAVIREHCARLVLVEKPRYREPRWSTLAPPEVGEFSSRRMRELLEETRRRDGLAAVQVEYTYLATYSGEILVEHDVTFDLYQQVAARAGTVAARWNAWRWRRFERAAVRRYRSVVVMSEKDRALLGAPHAVVVPNGVDLDRFRPSPETPGERLLFIGSFRHFPNLAAYRFFAEEVWPRLRDRFPEMTVTVVAGPDPELHAPGVARGGDARLKVLGFVADVKPLYDEANVVLAPTPVSAGTNLKVLEAMAMERAVVSTPSGCAGLGLVHGESVWIADGAEAFAEGIARLVRDGALRARLARASRRHAEQHYDWRAIGERQREVFRRLLPERWRFRAMSAGDTQAIANIQMQSPEASQWDPRDYLACRGEVVEAEGEVAGFLFWRQVAPEEAEILNVAVSPEYRGQGLGTRLVERFQNMWEGTCFLEVRETNQAGRKLYEKMGFSKVGERPDYYRNPPETAIVMRWTSC
jgi:ribosomal-protein-alanine acetyltransferase